MSSPNTTRVGDLVARHEGFVRASSPSSPPVSRTSPTMQRKSLSGNGTAEGETSQANEPTSPTPTKKDLPPQQDELLAPPQSANGGGENSAGTSLSGSTTLGDIQEDANSTEEDGQGSKEGEGESKGADGEAKKDGEAGAEATAEGAKAPLEEPTVEVEPLEAIRANLDSLPDQVKEAVKANLERIQGYPDELPLSASWTLHFSDTSGASKSNSAAATKDAYTEGINPVFTATTVPKLCSTLKAFKRAVRSKRAKPGDSDGFGLYRAGQNLHFFRSGISPTWEDPYNEKGGRITISPHANLFDAVYERLILLSAGASLEIQAAELVQNGGKNASTAGPSPDGMIMGVVASRRARGDRIEVWLGGKEKREAAHPDWIASLKEVIAQELELPELRTVKFKKHF
ncbi:hypothetical protein JCM11251_005535 [Rhodosporidiobolus azoricus]